MADGEGSFFLGAGRIGVINGAPECATDVEQMEVRKMPKIRTHKSASKRFRVTKHGKVLRNKAYGRHLLTGKPSHRRRRLRKACILCPADTVRVRRMLPYE